MVFERKTPERRNTPEGIAEELKSILKKDPGILQTAFDLLGEDDQLSLWRLATSHPTADEKNPRLAELFRGSKEWRDSLVAKARSNFEPGKFYDVSHGHILGKVKMKLISIGDDGVVLMQSNIDDGKVKYPVTNLL